MEVTINIYYLWVHGKNRKREARKNRLSVLIKSVFYESSKTYGQVRIQQELNAQKILCSKSYASQIMQELQLRSVHKRSFKVTTDSDHQFPVAENLLDRNFNPKVVNAVYAADITYIPTRQG